MKSLKDNCGVFGLYSDTKCVHDIFQGIDFLQHRGQEYCGISTIDGNIHQVTHYGKVAGTFKYEELEYLRGRMGIGHVSLWERQPARWQSQLGEIAVAFSGNVANVSTPGYRSRSIDFQAEFERMTGAGTKISGEMTHPSHLPLGHHKDGAPEIDETKITEGNINGVDIDHEVAVLAKNELQFTIAARLLQRKFQALKNAITSK